MTLPLAAASDFRGARALTASNNAFAISDRELRNSCFAKVIAELAFN
jgi:hypothetical protein